MAISLYSCLNDDDIQDIETSQDFIDYNIFPKGSYWIYQDSLTKELDSVYVKDISIHEDYYDKHTRLMYDKYQIEMTIHQLDILINTIMLPSVGEKIDYFPYSSLIKDKTSKYQNQLLKYQIKNHIWTPDAELIDNLIVHGNTYSNVYKQTNKADNEHNGKNEYSFFVKNIGCVKKKYVRNENINEIWELIRYKISNEPIKK